MVVCGASRHRQLKIIGLSSLKLMTAKALLVQFKILFPTPNIIIQVDVLVNRFHAFKKER